MMQKDRMSWYSKAAVGTGMSIALAGNLFGADKEDYVRSLKEYIVRSKEEKKSERREYINSLKDFLDTKKEDKVPSEPYLVPEKKKVKPEVEEFVADYNRTKNFDKKAYTDRLRQFVGDRKSTERDANEVTADYGDGQYRTLELMVEKKKYEAGLNSAEEAEVKGLNYYHMREIGKLDDLIAAEKSRDAKSGIVDNLEYLRLAYLSSEGKSDEVREGCKTFMKVHRNSEMFSAVAKMYFEDPLVYGKKAMTKAKINAVFEYFNALKDVAYMSVIGGTDGMFVDSIAAFGMQLYNISKNKKFATNNEIQALYAYVDAARRFPNNPKIKALKGQIEKLIRKDNEVLARREYLSGMRLVEKSLKDEELKRVYWSNAQAHFENAKGYSETAFGKKAEKEMEKLQLLVSQADKEIKLSERSQLGDLERSLNSDQWSKYQQLLFEKNSRRTPEDGKRLLGLVESYSKDFPEGMRANLEYIRAIALQTMGEHEAAVKSLEKIVTKYKDSGLADEVSDLLNDEKYCIMRALKQAKALHRRRKRNFLLFGGNKKGTIAKAGTYGVAGAIDEGMKGARGNFLGYMGIGSFSRVVAYLRNNDLVDQENLIDVENEYCRLRGEETEKVALDMGRRLFKQKKFGDAKRAFERAVNFAEGMSKADSSARDWITKTNEAWAEAIFNKGHSLKNDNQAIAYFMKIVEDFSDSKYADDALMSIADIYHSNEMFTKEREVLEEVKVKYPKNKRLQRKVMKRMVEL